MKEFGEMMMRENHGRGAIVAALYERRWRCLDIGTQQQRVGLIRDGQTATLVERRYNAKIAGPPLRTGDPARIRRKPINPGKGWAYGYSLLVIG
jgi:hypothetical protein